MKKPALILDFDGKFSHLAARLVRDIGVYCEVLPGNATAERLNEVQPGAVIVLGTPPGSPNIPWDVPVLTIDKPAAVNSDELRRFISEAGLEEQWGIKDYVNQTIDSIRNEVGNSTVLCALSGGVDSTVTAVMVNQAIGDRLTCIFVDHGLMRKNEAEEVITLCREKFNMKLIHVDAEARFLGKLAGVTDPEKKRKIIGEEFIRVFEEEARKLGQVDYLAQGTIYPDIIESYSPDGTLVKSHHNVGGLPDVIDFKGLIEPLRLLFKNEVRNAGLELGIDENIVWRQPFPGPGLAVRCIGEITKERLDILREADFIFRDEIISAGLHREISQYFAILTDIRSVGVRDDARSYDYTVALRAIRTTDFVSAEPINLPFDLLQRAMRRITAVPGISRVVYDITEKPPATIEWE